MNHLKQIAAKLDDYGLDAMLITSEPGELYAAGFHGEGVVLISKQECRYYTDSRYIEAAGKTVTGASVHMTDRSKNYRVLVEQAVGELCIRRMGYEEGYMTVQKYEHYKSILTCELLPAQTLIGGLRAAKDADEITAMQEAQRITELALNEILKFIKPGMTEREIAAKLQYDMLRFGAQRMSFDPIVVCGPNGSLPHGVPGDAKVEHGQFLTMDFGCIYNGYCSDMTRTVAVGVPDEEMRKVYEIVLQAQLAGIAAAKAGVTGKSIDAAARKVIEDAGYGEYFGHSFGHSVGIEIHESPNASATDESTMPVGAAISAEPGIYLPGRFGVRIEDVMILTEDGNINLTKAAKELIIL